MRRHRAKPRRRGSPSGAAEGRAVDERYGLEPVFEPGSEEFTCGGAGGVQLHAVHCPYCGERFETPVDLSSGSARYIEDCPVCCRPIEVSLEVEQGAVSRLDLRRGDE